MDVFASVWDEAGDNAEADAGLRALTSARIQVTPSWSFLAVAKDTAEFSHRFALIEESIRQSAQDHGVSFEALAKSLADDFRDLRAEAGVGGVDLNDGTVSSPEDLYRQHHQRGQQLAQSGQIVPGSNEHLDEARKTAGEYGGHDTPHGSAAMLGFHHGLTGESFRGGVGINPKMVRGDGSHIQHSDHDNPYRTAMRQVAVMCKGASFYVTDGGKQVGGPYDTKDDAQDAIDGGDVSGDDLQVSDASNDSDSDDSGSDDGGSGDEESGDDSDDKGGNPFASKGDEGSDDDPDDESDQDDDADSDSDDKGDNPFAKKKASFDFPVIAATKTAAHNVVHQPGETVFVDHFMGHDEHEGRKGVWAQVVASPGQHGQSDRAESHLLKPMEPGGTHFFHHFGSLQTEAHSGLPDFNSYENAGGKDRGPVGIQYPHDADHDGTYDVHCAHCGKVSEHFDEGEAWGAAQDHNERHPYGEDLAHKHFTSSGHDRHGSKAKVCSNCQGEGVDWAAQERCGMCGGTGKADTPRPPHKPKKEASLADPLAAVVSTVSGTDLSTTAALVQRFATVYDEFKSE